MKDIYQLEIAVNEFIKRHGMKLKKSSRNIIKGIYTAETTDYSSLEAKLIKMKNGNTRALFKVDGKVTSLYK